MALTSAYTIAAGRIPQLFEKIRDGQAPEQVSQQLLKDWGFSSSNDRSLIPLLKAIGFLSPDGKPTTRYHEYRDHSRSGAVMAEALREAYGDLFLIKEKPTDEDRKAIAGKFKSYHNVSDNVAENMTRTFYSLLGIADLTASGKVGPGGPVNARALRAVAEPDQDSAVRVADGRRGVGGLYYNIQIHLPATKDVEVFNAIFRSLREHLIEQ
ncbi:MAG: DUF5343 domain-containing protein [Trueperaceae bacterium]